MYFYNHIPAVSICDWHILLKGVHKSVRSTEPINMFEIWLEPFTKPSTHNTVESGLFIIPFLWKSLRWKRILLWWSLYQPLASFQIFQRQNIIIYMHNWKLISILLTFFIYEYFDEANGMTRISELKRQSAENFIILFRF